MSVRVGIGLFTGQVPAGSSRTFAAEYREMIDLVKLAEDVGFSSAWVSEHHGASDGYLPSLLVMLGAFAAATSTIELGTGVILTPLHDAVRLAEDAAVVDQLSDGRLLLGLGLGWREEEFRMLRIPITERLARHAETVEILRKAWRGERFSHDGDAFRFDRVRISPPPARPGGPPILLGGYVDAALRRAGELGDGHLTDGDDLEFLDHARRKAPQIQNRGELRICGVKACPISILGEGSCYWRRRDNNARLPFACSSLNSLNLAYILCGRTLFLHRRLDIDLVLGDPRQFLVCSSFFFEGLIQKLRD